MLKHLIVAISILGSTASVSADAWADYLNALKGGYNIRDLDIAFSTGYLLPHDMNEARQTAADLCERVGGGMRGVNIISSREYTKANRKLSMARATDYVQCPES